MPKPKRSATNRFEQRLHKHLQNKEFAAGFYEMAEELKRVQDSEMKRKQQKRDQDGK